MALSLNPLGLFGPKSKFRPGDNVQRTPDGPLMIVDAIVVSSKPRKIMVSCKWFDSTTKQTCTGVFPETELNLFDWYNPK